MNKPLPPSPPDHNNEDTPPAVQPRDTSQAAQSRGGDQPPPPPPPSRDAGGQQNKRDGQQSAREPSGQGSQQTRDTSHTNSARNRSSVVEVQAKSPSTDLLQNLEPCKYITPPFIVVGVQILESLHSIRKKELACKQQFSVTEFPPHTHISFLSCRNWAKS